jgi:hypothetical protein
MITIARDSLEEMISNFASVYNKHALSGKLSGNYKEAANSFGAIEDTMASIGIHLNYSLVDWFVDKANGERILPEFHYITKENFYIDNNVIEYIDIC